MTAIASISEQRYLGCFDDRHMFVAFVIDDIDRDLADLVRAGTGGSKRTAEIAKLTRRGSLLHSHFMLSLMKS